jgi:phosphoribosylaminoimidazolecarboxamide formyltransferase/IMP cyclohydrolase
MTSGTLIGKRTIGRALISVYDKSGLVPLARGLYEAGVDIVSTGSTAKTIADQGIPVTPVELVTGFPEILDGRVKTLHPHVHAGLLADTRNPDHVALAKLNIEPFDLVVVNLYPFSETVDSGAEIDECVEQIDIGGPSMVRAAAKNHASVAVVVDPLGYDGVLAAVRAGGFTLEERKKLAALAFRHTAEYDVAVASWMDAVLAPAADEPRCPRGSAGPGGAPPCCATARTRTSGGGLQRRLGWPGLAQAQQLHGKEMSYNNFTDADAAWRAAFDHEDLRGDHQAREPVRYRDLVGVGGRRAPQGPRVRSAVRVRRRDRGQHRGDGRDGRVRLGDLHRGDHRTGLRARCGDPGPQEEHSRLVAAEPPVDGVEIRQISGGLLMQERDCLNAPGDDPAGWTLATGPPRMRPPWPICASPGAPAARSSRTRSWSPPTGPPSAWAWARSTGSTPPGWPSNAAVIGSAARWPPATRSSRSPTAWRR